MEQPNAKPLLDPQGEVSALTLDQHGTWAVTSISATVYYLDLGLDHPPMLLRHPGPGSPTGPYDDVWLVLVEVASATDTGRIEIGRRHRYTVDPAPGALGRWIWWVQRTVTAITAVTDPPRGRAPGPHELDVGFGGPASAGDSAG